MKTRTTSKYAIPGGTSAKPASVESRSEMRECIFNKGQSKRIWNELYKVLSNVCTISSEMPPF